MLKDLHPDQVRFVALLANTARVQRDALLGNVAQADLDGTSPGRGEHNPTAELGVEPVPADVSEPSAALLQAVKSLPPIARQELYALMRIGQGHLAVQKWHRGLSEAETLGDEAIVGAIIDDPDLHDHLSKGLYEAERAR